MNFNELQIDGFGAWRDLRMPELAPGLNVIYGPNEAGKTTLLNFIRSVLYGFSDARRRRYLAAWDGRAAGGWLDLDLPEDVYRVRRMLVASDPLPPPPSLTITARDGHRLSPERLEDFLHQIDETTYEHVFAVGLDEIQELGTLNDTAAAAHLYSLTIGLDRVSLAEVVRELAASRRHLLGDSLNAGQIGRLLEQRSRLRGEIEAASDLTARYADLVEEREVLGQQAAELEAEIESLRGEERLVEVAVALSDRWNERASLEQQLARLNVPDHMPAGLLERLEKIQAGIRRRKRRLAKLRGIRRQLRNDAKDLSPQRQILDQAARIHALAEQQEWLAGLEAKSNALASQQLEIEQDIENQQAELDGVPMELLSGANVRSLAPLKALARTLEQRRQELDDARREAAATDRPQPAPVATLPPSELIGAAQAAGEKVSLLRRRVQLNQRLEQMAAQQQELEEQSGELADRQLLPLPMVIILGTVFVLGVVLVLAGWWLSFGWMVTVTGVAGVIGSIVMKYYLERTADQQLDHCDRQLATLRQQMEQLKQQRKELDAALPPGNGPLLVRLEAAEAELARLEELLPLDAQRKAVEQTTARADDRSKQAESAYQDELRHWRQSLHAAGWPAKLSPKQVWQIARRGRNVRELLRRQAQLQQEAEQTDAAIASFTERLRQLLADLELMPAGESASEMIRQLRAELVQQETLLRRRKELARRDGRYRRYQARERRAGRRLVRRRDDLVRQAGAVDVADLRRCLAEHVRRSDLLAGREALERDIIATLGNQFTEQAVRRYLEETPLEELRLRQQRHTEELQGIQAKLRERLERRGQVQHELQLLADDRRLGQLHLELGQVDRRLELAIERWKTSAVASQALETVRRQYERDRQPQTLQEASVWLERLTRGRYCRVWTPLGEDVLLVDDAQGASHTIDNFSRGTREQLFLALRLALVKSYADRGVRLPMVLDDVLVNFDIDRARAAARVLKEFGEDGHQLLVFTCHEHLAEIFLDLHVPVRQLPRRMTGGVVEELTPLPKKPARRKRLPEPAPILVEPVVEAPVEEPAPIVEPILELPILESVPAEPEAPAAAEPFILLEEAPPEPAPSPMEYLVAPPEVVEPPAFVLPVVEPVTSLPVLPSPPPAQPIPRPKRRRRTRLQRPKRNPQEALFAEYDGLFPWNDEPTEAAYYFRDEPEEHYPHSWIEPWPAEVEPESDEVWPQESRAEADWTTEPETWSETGKKWVWIGGHWLGEGAEEFEGEFAVRPARSAMLAEELTSKELTENSRRRRGKRAKADPSDAEAA